MVRLTSMAGARRMLAVAAGLTVLGGGGLESSSAATAPTRPDPDGARWWSHIAVLASDAYEGRLTGSPGYLKAAAYVADHFKAAGLKPAGANGTYLQPVALVSQTVDGGASHVTLTAGDKTQP